MPSTYFMANQMLSVLQNKPALFVGLFLSLPERDGQGGHEVNGAGYARQSVAFGNPDQGQMSNISRIDFPQSTEDWGEVVGMGIWDAQVGGTLLWFDNFTNPLNITVGNFFMLRISDLKVMEGSCPCPAPGA